MKKLIRKDIKEAQDSIRPYAHFPLPTAFYQSLLEGIAERVKQDESFRRWFQEEVLAPGIERMKTELEPYLEMMEKAVIAIKAGDPEPFFRFLTVFGPRILKDEEAMRMIEDWWFEKMTSKGARDNLKRVGKALAEKVSGRPEVLREEERKAIAADCERWFPICQRLNKAFKRLREESRYQASELYRKEARGRLAEEFSISTADVEAIEWYLKKPSRRASKTPPYEATLRIVTRKNPQAGGIKTVENIWQKSKTRGTKTSTTPVAGRIL